MTHPVPKVFFSYSHDSESHKGWVLTLATRLLANGVEVILDQWDLKLGSDLPRFMEGGLTSADRVIAVCTEQYVVKSNAGKGGVGYEKMILTAQLMENIATDRIIPAIRANSCINVVPTFLSSRLYIDFRDDLSYESKYAELLHDIHGMKIKPRPPLGSNPFLNIPVSTPPLVSFGPARYVSPSLRGNITFDYSNNNGRYILGAGDMAFETAWSGGSDSSIYAYSDPPSILTIALAVGVHQIENITDSSVYDNSSRVRRPQIGEIVLWHNTAGYYLATLVESVKSRSYGSDIYEIKFSYVIAPNKSLSFSHA